MEHRRSSSLTTRALPGQSIGPTEVRDGRGCQRAGESRDGAEAQDGQGATAVQGAASPRATGTGGVWRRRRPGRMPRYMSKLLMTTTYTVSGEPRTTTRVAPPASSGGVFWNPTRIRGAHMRNKILVGVALGWALLA